MHLENHDVTMIAVSRAPIASLQAYKRRMGWTFTWASSLDSDFNYDFNNSFTEEQQRSGSIDYNYSHTLATTPDSESGSKDRQDPLVPGRLAAMTCTDVPTRTREAPGMSALALFEGVVYHTYSTYARGLDALWGMYQWLDRAPNGRNEPVPWLRRRDEYHTRFSITSPSKTIDLETMKRHHISIGCENEYRQDFLIVIFALISTARAVRQNELLMKDSFCAHKSYGI